MVYKLYFSMLVIIAIVLILFGGVFPYLISSTNTELVVLGMISIPISLAILIFMLTKIVNNLRENFDKNLKKGFNENEKN